MVEAMARNWGWVLLRGVAAILFGIFALAYPGMALRTLVLVFGAYALVDGIALIVAAVADRKGEDRWGVLMIGGLLGIMVGIFTFMKPDITAVALLYVIAAWAIILGIAEIVAAIELRKVITDEWMLIVSGVAAVAFGVFLIARPAAGALAVVIWIGVYALITGGLQCALAFKLRSWGRSVSPAVSAGHRRATV